MYVKNLTAGKLESRAQLGHFVGYDSESKGYRIYWPDKWSIMVEQNIIFNESDVLSTNTTALIPGDALDEGEKEKVIQSPQIQHTEECSTQPVSLIAPDISDTMASDDPLPIHISNEDESAQLGYGCQPKKPMGVDKQMHKGLTAAIASSDDPNLDSTSQDPDDWLPEVSLEFALATISSTALRTIDEALNGPNSKQWKMGLDYKISQLEKLKTWVIEDLPKGQTVIPCSEVLKEKQGPSGKIETYHVQIVAGGHK